MQFTQDNLALGAGLQREVITKVESGANLGTSHKLRIALARGFHVSAEVFNEYLEGTRDIGSVAGVSLAAQLSGLSISTSTPSAPEIRRGRFPKALKPSLAAGQREVLEKRLASIEVDVGAAFEKSRHRVSDATATMELVRNAIWPPEPNTTGLAHREPPLLPFNALRWLDLAAWMRLHGIEVTSGNALCVALQRSPEDLQRDLLIAHETGGAP